MRLYWYNPKTGEPRIAVGSPLMLAGTIPLCFIAGVSIVMQLNGLVRMGSVGFIWRLINVLLLVINLYYFVWTIISNPGIDKKLFRK